MVDETPSPKHKLRRWVIPGVLLLMVVVTAWWCWPRRDARFVGRWLMKFAAINDQGADVELIVDLTPDGLVSYTEPDTGRKMGPERWATGGSAYRFGTPTPFSGMNGTISRLTDVLPISVSTRSVEWRIESIGEQTIEMTTGTGRRVTLRRIP